MGGPAAEWHEEVAMRPLTLLVAVGVLSTGCTHAALERRTVKQASTLTDLQYRQVMDNLAMFSRNPEALPWHVKVKGGLIQIADQGSGGFGADIATLAGEGTRLLPAVTAQRGIVGQWDVDPASDPDELEMLRLAYKKAICPADDEARQEILKKICELSVRFDLLPQEETIKLILAMDKGQEALGWIIDGLRQEAIEIKRKITVLNTHIGRLPGDKLELIPQRAQLEKEKDELDASLKFVVEQYWTLKDFATKGSAEIRPLADDPDLKKYLIEQKLVIEDNQVLRRNPARNQNQKQAPARGSERAAKRGPQDASDTMLRLLTAIHHACAPGYLPRTDLKWETERNAALIDQAEDKVRKLESLLNEPIFQTPWLNCGQKKDVPRCACYVGRYRDCLGERYVWVTPEGLKTLREFTLVILTLAPIEKQDVVSGRGAAFSPSIR